MLKSYHDSGWKIGLARRDVLGVFMPTQSLLDHMLKKYKLEDFTQENINKLQNRLAPLHAMNDELFHHADRFFVTYQESDLKLVLKVMEAFDRYTNKGLIQLSATTWHTVALVPNKETRDPVADSAFLLFKTILSLSIFRT